MDNELVLKEIIDMNIAYENILHDIKTPMTVIYSIVDLMHLYIDNPAWLRDNLCLLEKNTLRIIKLMNDARDFSKIAHGSFKPTLKRHDIVALTSEVIESIMVVLRNKERKIFFHSDTEEKYTYTDKDLYQRILFNILTNAIKFTVDKGVIDVFLEDLDDCFILKVRDNGVGIGSENGENLFLRYSMSRRNNKGGSGLGLSIVKDLVEVLEGEISIFNNSEMPGTTVAFRIPYKSKIDDEEYDLVNYFDDLFSNKMQQIELSLTE